MPTLLEPGNLVPQKWHDAKERQRIKTMPPIQWLMEYFEARISPIKNVMPLVRPLGLGSRVTVLKSGTGSGKSTTIPVKLFDTFFERIRKNIAITQPRVLTAVDIPFQIMQYNKHIKLGENIGYQTGAISKKPVKGMTFMTTGTLLQQLKVMTDEDIMRKYSFIIIDEVHERSIDVDSTLYYLKQFLSRNWNNSSCPLVILMSATFDPNVFMKYFKCPKENYIQVTGSTYPIEKHFSKFDISDYLNYAVDITEKIHIDNIADIDEDKTFRDILIFVNGGAEMKTIIDKLHKLNTDILGKSVSEIQAHSTQQIKKYGGKEIAKKVKPTYYLAPIALTSEGFAKGGKDYRDLFSNIRTVQVGIYKFSTDSYGNLVRELETKTYVKPSRRVIVATNVAETGVTIDTLGYCIDTGFVNSAEFNPNFNCSLILKKNITKAASEQRRGRVGRKAPGTWYGLYTEDTWKTFLENQFPDIIVSDISQALLSIIIGETGTELLEQDVGARDPDCFQMNQFDQKWYKLIHKKPFMAGSLDFIQYPSSDSISSGTEKLYGLGFIDHEYKPTLFGYYAAKFRKLKLENIRMILAGYSTGANILDLITIACCLEIGTIGFGIKRKKYIPRNVLKLSDEVNNYYYKLLIADEFIEYLFIWHDFMMVTGKVGDLLEKKSERGVLSNVPLNYLPKWCEENNFKLDGLMAVVELRDEIIENMLMIGLNPYFNGMDLPRGLYNLVHILERNLSEGMSEIKKMKMSIYEGYRANLCVCNIETQRYINRQNCHVELESKIIKPIGEMNDEIQQKRPQKIIVSQIMVSENPFEKGMYIFKGGDVSVMDGFVDIDREFLDH
jgi:HrpA-like RNA helicase